MTRNDRNQIAGLAAAVALFTMTLAAQVATAPAVKGHTRVVDGLGIVFVHGDLGEQGFAEGYLCAPQIAELFSDFALKNSFMPNPKAWDVALRPQIQRSTTFPSALTTWAAAVVEGMRARDAKHLHIAELDRDLDATDLLGAATLPDVIGLMCSSVAVFGEAARSRGPLVGRNLDYFATPKLLQHAHVIVRGPTDGRQATVTLGWPGLPGTVTGVSAAGVFLAIHDVPKKRIGHERCVPRTAALRDVLETLVPGDDTIARAHAALVSHRYGMGGNLMFAFAGGAGGEGGAAVFEIAPDDLTEDGVTVRRPVAEDRSIACSNHHREREEPAVCWRYDALAKGAGGDHDPIDLATMQKLIRKSEVAMTLHQVVVDLGERKIAFRVKRSKASERSAGEWTETGIWSLDALFAEVGVGARALERVETGGAKQGR
jgi:hypothetical protein